MSFNLKPNHIFKYLIIAKGLILSVIFLNSTGLIEFGEQPISAADQTSASSTDENSDQLPSGARGSDASGTSGTGFDQTSGSKTSDGADDEQPRRGFLADLLNLPALDSDNVKRAELGRYLEIAERKKKQVEDRLVTLEKREKQLIALENSIEDKIKKLEDERRFFAQTIQKEKDLKGQRTEKLVSLYSKMEPKKAAPIFENIDKDLAVQMFKSLPQKQITAILEKMSAESSVELTEYYGRVRSVREYELLREMNQSLKQEFAQCRGLPADPRASDS